MIELNPDVMIVTEPNYKGNKSVVEKIEAAGVPVVCINYYDTETIEGTADRFTRSTMILGKLLGKPERARELLDWYENQKEKVLSKLTEKKMEECNLKVYLETCCTKWNTYGNVRNGLVIEQLGGTNIAAGRVQKMGTLSPEYVLDSKPDVIIGTARGQDEVPLGYYSENRKKIKKKIREFMDRPGFDTLPAIKNGRVYYYHHMLCHGHIWDVLNYQVIGKALYPELFEDLDPEKGLKSFHEKFLPVDYSGTWFVLSPYQ